MVVAVCHAAQGNGGLVRAALSFVFPETPGHSGLRRPGRDTVDTDVLRREFSGEVADEGVEPPFGSRVGVEAGVAELCGDRRDEDNFAGGAGAEVGKECLGEQEGALQVDIKDIVPRLLIKFSGRRSDVDAGGMNEDVDLLVVRDNIFYGGFDLTGVLQIAGDC